MIQGEAKKLWTRVSTIDNFFVKFRRRSESSWTESSVASDSRTFILRDLLCGSEYEFVLLVSSRVGNSSASNTVTAKTKGSPPEYLPRTYNSIIWLFHGWIFRGFLAITNWFLWIIKDFCEFWGIFRDFFDWFWLIFNWFLMNCREFRGLKGFSGICNWFFWIFNWFWWIFMN